MLLGLPEPVKTKGKSVYIFALGDHNNYSSSTKFNMITVEVWAKVRIRYN
jgi:hypothetical protein